MSDSPAVRAGWPKLAMRFVKRLPEPSAKAILGRAEPLREKVRAATFRDFIELTDFVEMADATLDVLGLVETRRLWHDVMLEALEQPAVGELVRRAGVGNRDPLPLLQRTADAYYFVHRHCGTWIVEGNAEAQRASVTLDQAPAPILESPAMQAVYWGNVKSVLTKLGIQGAVAMLAEPTQRRVRYTVRWTSASA